MQVSTDVVDRRATIVKNNINNNKLSHVNGVPKGIRTPVTAVKGRCPRPLDDGDAGRSVEKLGGARRDRTADLLHAMQALSQLSYSPFEAGTLRTPAHAVKKPGAFHRFDGKSITWLGLSPRLTQEVLINTDVLVQAV